MSHTPAAAIKTGTCDLCGKPALAAQTGPRRLCPFHERITQPGIVWGVRHVPAKK